MLHQQHLQTTRRRRAQSSKMVHVALFVPNLIGYIRVILLYVCYATAMRDWKIATSCYILSFAGDLLDGWAARKFDQSSRSSGMSWIW